MSCIQLRAEAGDVRKLEQQIEAIAAGDRTALKDKPILYSTAKPDADRAAAARREAITAALLAKDCPT